MPAERLGNIVFPPEWLLGRSWLRGHPSVVLASDDETMFAAGGVADDGSNLIGICWPGGQRVLRASPDTDWAIEERFAGDPPDQAAKAWAVLVDCFVRGMQDARAELGGSL